MYVEAARSSNAAGAPLAQGPGAAAIVRRARARRRAPSIPASRANDQSREKASRAGGRAGAIDRTRKARASPMARIARSVPSGEERRAALTDVGTDHRLADTEPLAAMLKAFETHRQQGVTSPPHPMTR